MRFNLGLETPMQTKMLINSLMGGMLVVVGFAGNVSYKLAGGDIEFLIASMAALAGGLGVLAAESVRKDLYDHMTEIKA